MSYDPQIQIKLKPGGVRELLVIALPMVISNACEVVMTFTDRLFLSKIGPEQMSAAMAGGLTCYLMMTFIMGLTNFSTALVAQNLGSGRKEKCASVFAQALIICVAAYPVILLLRPVGPWLFTVANIDEAQLTPQIQYYNILLYAVIVSLVRNALSCFFSGIGKTRVVMLSAMVAMAVNIFMNYVLIFGKLGFPEMGIRGAALGTVCGGVCGMLCLIIAFFSPKNRAAYNVMAGLRFNWSIMKPLLRFGYPAGIEFFLNLTAFTAAIFIFHSRGAETAAAVTILFNWDMLTFIPLIGVQIGVMSLVGRYMGAGDPETASRAAISGLKCGWMYSAVMLIMFVGFSGHLVEMFRPSDAEKIIAFEEQVAPMARFLVKTIAFYIMMEAVVIVFSGALRGAGDTFWAMCISVSMHWIIVPVLYIMLKVYDTSAEAGWVAFISIFMFFAFVFYLRFKTGKWKSIKVVEHEEEAPLLHSDFHETPDL